MYKNISAKQQCVKIDFEPLKANQLRI